MKDDCILTLSCANRAGIVHAVPGVLAAAGANIREAAQFNDPATGLFFMRVQFIPIKRPQDGGFSLTSDPASGTDSKHTVMASVCVPAHKRR